MITKNSNKDNNKKVVSKMIDMYCKGHNHSVVTPCGECQDLKDYVYGKIEACPFVEKKIFCSSCKIHCYNTEMKNNIKDVMRYSGPRIVFYHPILCIKHALEYIKMN